MAPLVETLSGFEQICVLVTNKEKARIFQAYAGEITEQTGIFDQVLKHHNQGGWEQAKLQRRHELQVRNHLKKASEATLEYFKKEHFDRLVVGVADELWPELERVLHPYLLERLAGRFSVDINAPVDEVLAKVTAIEQERRSLEESITAGIARPGARFRPDLRGRPRRRPGSPQSASRRPVAGGERFQSARQTLSVLQYARVRRADLPGLRR